MRVVLDGATPNCCIAGVSAPKLISPPLTSLQNRCMLTCVCVIQSTNNFLLKGGRLTPSSIAFVELLITLEMITCSDRFIYIKNIYVIYIIYIYGIYMGYGILMRKCPVLVENVAFPLVKTILKCCFCF